MPRPGVSKTKKINRWGAKLFPCIDKVLHPSCYNLSFKNLKCGWSKFGIQREFDEILCDFSNIPLDLRYQQAFTSIGEEY